MADRREVLKGVLLTGAALLGVPGVIELAAGQDEAAKARPREGDLLVKIEDGAEACQTFVSSVRKHMDDAIYGHDDAKLQILQFVSNWIANPMHRIRH